MPCYDPPPSYDELAERNFMQYGVRCTFQEMLKAIACEAMHIVEEEGLGECVSEYAQRWWAEHKAQDAARKQRG